MPDTPYEDKRTLKLLLLVQDCEGLSTERSQLRPNSWRHEQNTPARSSVYLPVDETVAIQILAFSVFLVYTNQE